VTKTASHIFGITLTGVLALILPARADTFGSGANAFTIDFVDIGNPGNADDTGAGDGLYFSPYGGVGYEYRMAVTEVPDLAITRATNLGLGNVTAGYFFSLNGERPAASMSWYEMAAFVNWLNTSTGHQPAYNLRFSGGWIMTLWNTADAWQAGGENRFRHKDAYYFLPSEDEWYKAAYHKNDGVTANFWDYATASNAIPTPVASGTEPGTAIYNNTVAFPWEVDDVGGLSAYGTRGQSGNVWELLESAFDGVNDFSARSRTFRGGSWVRGEDSLRSSSRLSSAPELEGGLGFRVASVPEPSPAMVMIGSGVMFLIKGRRALAN
jgi:hypothetical protein